MNIEELKEEFRKHVEKYDINVKGTCSSDWFWNSYKNVF